MKNTSLTRRPVVQNKPPSEWQQLSGLLLVFQQPFAFVRFKTTPALPLQLTGLDEHCANDSKFS